MVLAQLQMDADSDAFLVTLTYQRSLNAENLFSFLL